MKKYIKVDWSSYTKIGCIKKILMHIPIIRWIFVRKVHVHLIAISKNAPIFGLHYYDLIIPNTPILYLKYAIPTEMENTKHILDHFTISVREGEKLINTSIHEYASEDTSEYFRVILHLFPTDLAPKC